LWRSRFAGEEVGMARRGGRGVRRDEKQWVEILRRFEGSGLGITAFCEREGLSLSSLQRWRKQLGSKVGARFVELVPATPAPSTEWTVEFTFPNGVSVRLRG
jgi:transposase-like protein